MTQKNNEDKEKRREKLLELQMLDSQIKQIEEQIMQIEAQVFEVNTVIESLSEIKSIKAGTDILVPVTNGIFANAKITETDKLKVNVGTGVVVEKTVDETKEMLKEQMKNIESYKEEMFLQLQKMIAQASIIQSEIIG